jgi:hypothetical protein
MRPDSEMNLILSADFQIPIAKPEIGLPHREIEGITVISGSVTIWRISGPVLGNQHINDPLDEVVRDHTVSFLSFSAWGHYELFS